MRKEKKKQVSDVAAGLLRANSSVLSRLLNVSSDDDDVTVAGKLFHTRAAATGKAQSPTVDKRVEGTLSASCGERPNCCQAFTFAQYVTRGQHITPSKLKSAPSCGVVWFTATTDSAPKWALDQYSCFAGFTGVTNTHRQIEKHIQTT